MKESGTSPQPYHNPLSKVVDDQSINGFWTVLVRCWPAGCLAAASLLPYVSFYIPSERTIVLPFAPFVFPIHFVLISSRCTTSSLFDSSE